MIAKSIIIYKRPIHIDYWRHKPSGTVIVVFTVESRFGNGVYEVRGGKYKEQYTSQDARTRLSFGNRIVPSQIRHGPPGMSAIFK